MRGLGILLAAMLVLAGGRAASAATELQFWHAMPGRLGEWVGDLADGFNRSQTAYTVVPVYKGNYAETMRLAMDAAVAGHPPHMVQVFEVGAATMMATRGLVKPVYEVMAESGLSFDPDAYIQAVRLFYSNLDGRMLSMPFNASTPVFFYNRTAFRKAGLDPAKPPATWPEVERAGKALLAAGYPCGFTTQWQSWIQLENLSAWHDIAFATKHNGIAGFDIELKFNSPFHVRHIRQLAAWHKSGLFVYGGRRNESEAKFIAGECPMMFATSAAYAELKAKTGLDVGIAMLPIWPEIAWAPRNSIIGGATVWVLNGHPPQAYGGVARFFAYLSSPEVQAASHQRTGYLPITYAAHDLSRRQGFYAANPDLDVATRQITLHAPTEHSKGVRLGNFVAIREVIDEELEAVWAGRKDAKAALDDAVRRGNVLLKDFNRARQ
ncbi:MAG: sn-glycerol-3-phosphate ABC transporter substrate-binding protein UgpB [Magnetospirillum sp.]|nr:sn-glycerol-3-phosphate ABC transporter substrate-binding protein UgpB [Magnetospirillum sp.]